MENIACHLTRRAAQDPERLAVVAPTGRSRNNRPVYSQLTFHQLDRESDLAAAALLAAGIVPGDRVVLMVKPSLEFFTLVFALFKAGIVPVMIDPGMGLRRLGRCLAEVSPRGFIGMDAAHLARLLFHWPPREKRAPLITTGRLPWGGAITLAALRTKVTAVDSLAARPAHAANGDDLTAAILFTSGSTGAAKGVVYQHGHFAAQIALIRQLWHITPGEHDLCTFPLFALFAPAFGMTAVIPAMDFTRPGAVDPRRILEAFEYFPISNMFGSPALLSRLAFAKECVSGGRSLFASLRRVVSAGAPAVHATLSAMTRLLPEGAQIHTPYGATEALPVATITSDEIFAAARETTRCGTGICVGRPAPDTEVAVIRIHDAPYPEWDDTLRVSPGTIGEIVVRGPQVTACYFGRPANDRLAKIPVPGSAAFYHRMGDVGYCDATGRLWFCGRLTQRVVLPDGDLFTIPTEAIFNRHEAVRRAALVGVATGPSHATEPLIWVEPVKRLTSNERERVVRELTTLAKAHKSTSRIRRFLFYPRFPVDVRHNSKIFREKLARWATFPAVLRWLLP